MTDEESKITWEMPTALEGTAGLLKGNTRTTEGMALDRNLERAFPIGQR